MSESEDEGHHDQQRDLMVESLRAMEEEIRVLEDKVRLTKVAAASATTGMKTGARQGRHLGFGAEKTSGGSLPGAMADRSSFSKALKQGRELALRDIFFMVRERWLLGLAVGILLAGAFSYWMLTRPAIYRADAEILIELRGNRALPEDLQEVDEEFQAVQETAVEQAMSIHMKNLESESFRAMVEDSLTEPEILAFAAPFLEVQEEWRPGEGDGADSIQGQPRAWRMKRSREIFARRLVMGMEISRESREQFINIAYQHPVPEVAQWVTNRIAQIYNDFVKQDSQEIHQDAQVFLDARIEDLEASIAQRESDLQAHRKRFDILSDDDETGSSPKLSNLNMEITRLKLEIVDREVELTRIEAFSGDPLALARLPSIAAFEPVAELLRRLEANLTEFRQLEARYLNRHPKMVDNRRNRSQILESLVDSLGESVAEFKSDLEKRRGQLRNLESELESATKELVAAKKPYVELRAMQKQLEMVQTQYEQLLQRRNDSRIVGMLDSARIKVIRPAKKPIEPVVPNVPRVLQLAIVLFLGCLVGLPVGVGFFDSRLKSFSEAQAFLETECIGVVGEQRVPMVDLGIAVLSNLNEQFTEAFRVLYTGIHLGSREPYPKVMLVTSSAPSEGKSTITANLAAMFARHRKRVLVVDADFREPSQHKFVNVRNSAGLLKFFRLPEEERRVPQTAKELSESKALGLVSLKDDHSLFLLRAGGQTRDPSEILAHEQFEQLFDTFREVFDLILIDTPPVGLFPDALLLSRLAEETLFVCKHNGVNRYKIKFALTKMQNSQSHVVGTVINQMSASRRYHYGYQDYGYWDYRSKDYAKYYGEEEQS